MMRHPRDQKLIEQAADALRAACELLDKRFGFRQWRREWTIADTLQDVWNEAYGYPSFDDADHEARTRGGNWRAAFDERGAAIVTEGDE